MNKRLALALAPAPPESSITPAFIARMALLEDRRDTRKPVLGCKNRDCALAIAYDDSNAYAQDRFKAQCAKGVFGVLSEEMPITRLLLIAMYKYYSHPVQRQYNDVHGDPNKCISLNISDWMYLARHQVKKYLEETR